MTGEAATPGNAALTPDALAQLMYEAGTAEVERLYPGTGGMTPLDWDQVKAGYPASAAMWLASAAAAVAAPLNAEITALREQLAEWQAAAKRYAGQRDTAIAGAERAMGELRDMTGERDAARAELAALRQDAFDAAKIADRYRAALKAIAASDGTCGAKAREALEGGE